MLSHDSAQVCQLVRRLVFPDALRSGMVCGEMGGGPYFDPVRGPSYTHLRLMG